MASRRADEFPADALAVQVRQAGQYDDQARRASTARRAASPPRCTAMRECRADHEGGCASWRGRVCWAWLMQMSTDRLDRSAQVVPFLSAHQRPRRGRARGARGAADGFRGMGAAGARGLTGADFTDEPTA